MGVDATGSVTNYYAIWGDNGSPDDSSLGNHATRSSGVEQSAGFVYPGFLPMRYAPPPPVSLFNRRLHHHTLNPDGNGMSRFGRR